MARSWKAALGALVVAAGAAPAAWAQQMPGPGYGMMGPQMGPMGPQMGPMGPDMGPMGSDMGAMMATPGEIMNGPGGSCCRPDYGCGDPCDSRGWYLRGEALALTRSGVRGQALSILNLTGDIVFATSELDFDLTIAPRVTLGKVINDCYTLEGIYFGNLHQTFNRNINGLALDPIFGTLSTPFVQPGFNGGPFSVTGPLGNGTNTDQNYTYTSNLHNIELNLKIDLGQGLWGSRRTLLYGTRYVDLQEQFNADYIDTATPATASYRIDTHNHLIGQQLGMEWGWSLTNCLAVSVWGKAGLSANIANQDSYILDELGTLHQTARSQTTLAGITEVGILGEWAVDRKLSLYGGYQVYHMSGLALAPEQLDFTAQVNSQRFINATGSATWYGPSAGIEYRW